MLVLTILIQIGDYAFDYVHKLNVKSSWATLTDTARVEVPRKLRFRGKSVAAASALFKRGDAVTIQAGYDGDLRTLFTGYVSAIKPGETLVFECEDAAWLLKQKSVTKSYASAKLADVLADALPSGIQYEAADVSLGAYRISDANAAEALADLRKTYGLYSYFRDGTLYSGFVYSFDQEPNETAFAIGRNVVDYADLDYVKAEDAKIKVRAVSVNRDNTTHETQVGDEDGDLRTLFFYEVDQAELKKLADESIARLRYEGYRGAFKAFGTPFVRHSEVVNLSNRLESGEAPGSYYVKAVAYDISATGGYRQTITLDRIAA